VPRPRTSSDDEILARVSDALELSDGPWTLAGAAAAAGLHPATLIKRFGSRRGVLLALSRRWFDQLPTGPAPDDPYAELLAWAESLSTRGSTPERVLARIDMLAEDLRDPELRLLLNAGWQRQLEHLTRLVAGAAEQGRLRTTIPPETAAQILMDAATGALLRAAASPCPRESDPRTSVHHVLEALT
jgi:AcrR family transcriptional regulator